MHSEYNIFFLNPYLSKTIYWNFQRLEVVSRYRGIHNLKSLQITHICLIWDQTFTNVDVKIVIWSANKKLKNDYSRD